MVSCINGSTDFCFNIPNEKVCVWSCLTLQSQMTHSAMTISFWVIYVWLCRDSTDFFSDYLSISVWLCRDFDFHTEQCSAENRPTFRCIQTGLLCRARSKIIIRDIMPHRWKMNQHEGWPNFIRYPVAFASLPIL